MYRTEPNSFCTHFISTSNMRVFLLYSLLVLVSGVPLLPLSSYKDVTVSGFREIKQRLQQELAALTQTAKSFHSKVSSEYTPSLDELIILSRNFLTSELYEQLGLSLESIRLKLPVGESVLFPKDSRNLFLFNTSESLKTANGNIRSSPPFQLPSVTNLIDFYLVVPKQLLTDSTLDDYKQHFVKASISDIPIFKHFSEFKPLMVFMFDSENTSSHSLNTVFNLKNYLLLSSYSTFFDNFAANWIKSAGYENLVSSLFCSTNDKQTRDSYCVEIKDATSLHWFPFYGRAKKPKNNIVNKRALTELDVAPSLNNTLAKALHSANESNIKLEAQVLRQIHDKLNVGAIKFNDVTYELAHDPKPLVERVDERVDSKINRVENKLKSYPHRLSNKKHEALELLDEKEEVLKEKVAEAKHKLLKLEGSYSYKNRPYNEVDDYENNGNWEEDESGWDEDCIYDEDNTDYENNGNWDGGEEEDCEVEYLSTSGRVVPLSTLNLKTFESPRTKFYSQVYDGNKRLEKRKVIFTNDDDCEEITWYNVFHHSLFGDANFCANKTIPTSLDP